MLLGGAQPHVHIEVSEGDCLALGVFGGRRACHLDSRLGRVAGLGGGLAVFVGRAGIDDLAAGLILRDGDRGLCGGGQNCHAKGSRGNDPGK